MTDFSVVIPMYNEVGNVARLVEELVEPISEYEFEVVLVDDGSKDGTSAELAAVAEGEPRVRVVYLTANSNARTCRSFILINAQAVMQAMAVVVIRNGPRKSNLLRDSGEFG